MRLPIKPILICAFLAGLSAQAQDHMIVGSGAPRSGYEVCNRDLSKFEKNLETHGFQTLTQTRCEPLSEDPSLYQPIFRALATTDVSLETMSGSIFSALSYCQMDLDRLVKNFDKKEDLLEAVCKPVHVANSRNGTDELYQPTLVLLNHEVISRPDSVARVAAE